MYNKGVDFHQGFHYGFQKELNGGSRGNFKLRERYARAEDWMPGDSIPKLQFPLILLSTINASGFIGCFCEIF